jgi:hypothetical protein
VNQDTQGTARDRGSLEEYTKNMPFESDNKERITNVFLVRSEVKAEKVGIKLPFLHWALGISFSDEDNFWVLLEGIINIKW